VKSDCIAPSTPLLFEISSKCSIFSKMHVEVCKTGLRASFKAAAAAGQQ
jgi:hypothetical protein